MVITAEFYCAPANIGIPCAQCYYTRNSILSGENKLYDAMMLSLLLFCIYLRARFYFCLVEGHIQRCIYNFTIFGECFVNLTRVLDQMTDRRRIYRSTYEHNPKVRVVK